jgi:hypothetical protein
MSITNPEDSIYYVYALLDPRKPGPFTYGNWKFSHEPFYIGKGKKNRINYHDEKDKQNPFKARVISRIKQDGFKDCIRQVKRDFLTSTQASELEIYLISKVGRRNFKLGPLTNLTDGGEGGSNFSKKTLKKISSNSKLAHANRTPEEKVEHNLRCKKGCENRNETERTKRRLETLSTFTKEKRISIGSKISENTKRYRSEESNFQRSERTRKRLLVMNAKTPEEKLNRELKISEGSKKSHALRTPEQKRISKEKELETKQKKQLNSMRLALNKSFEKRGIAKRFEIRD